MAARRSTAAACPCGSGAPYSRCCRPLHLRATTAATAEQLMRSRYSAYAKGLVHYLEYSWHPAHRPTTLDVDPNVRWVGLEVTDTVAGGPEDDTGIVEFVASYEAVGSGREVLRERSRFERFEGRWVYTVGI